MLKVFDLLMIEQELSRIHRMGKINGILEEFLQTHEELIQEIQHKIEDELEVLEYDFEEQVESIEDFEQCLDIVETNILELSEFGAKIIDALEQLLADNIQKELD